MGKQKQTSWKVEFQDDSTKDEYIKAFRSGKISADDNRLILKWIDVIESEGLAVVQQTPFWHDHALDGEWRGFRSASFSKTGRIIYKIVDDVLIVSVVRVTPDHDYKR